MKRSRILAAVIAAAAVLGFWSIWRRSHRAEVPLDQPTSARTVADRPATLPPHATTVKPAAEVVAAAPLYNPSVPTASPSPAPAVTMSAALPDLTPIPGELSAANDAATNRMVAAHASLRMPAAADPDSEANRRILRVMVGKALARRDATAAPAQ